MAVNPFEQQEARRKELEWIAKAAAVGEQATEPPYADAKLGDRHIVAADLYKASSCTNRGLSIHNGPIHREPARADASRDCWEWMRTDKQYSPYSYFDTAQSRARFEAMKKEKRRQSIYKESAPAVFFPTRRWDRPSQKKSGTTSGQAGTNTKPQDDKTVALPEGFGPPVASSTLIDGQDKPRWDTEHHIMVSRMNHEVRPGEREYFDQPKMKEGEGAPRIRQEYVMHDRQCCWNDEPTADPSVRRTCFHWVAPHNVGGPKVLQLPSYWRRVKDWRSLSEPGLQMSATSSRTSSEKKKFFLEALADTPADQARNFWREWSQQSKNRTGPKQQSLLFSKTKSLKKFDDEAPEPGSQGDRSADIGGKNRGKRRAQAQDWDDRWNITHSKDNEHYSTQHRQLFSSACTLSGAEFGRPDKFLTLRSQTWRGCPPR